MASVNVAVVVGAMILILPVPPAFLIVAWFACAAVSIKVESLLSVTSIAVPVIDKILLISTVSFSKVTPDNMTTTDEPVATVTMVLIDINCCTLI